MHRAYQPITAANNKLLKKRWDQRQYDLHRAKVHTSRAVTVFRNIRKREIWKKKFAYILNSLFRVEKS